MLEDHPHRLLACLLVDVTLGLVVSVHATLKFRFKSEPGLDSFLTGFESSSWNVLEIDGDSCLLGIVGELVKADLLLGRRLEVDGGETHVGDGKVLAHVESEGRGRLVDFEVNQSFTNVGWGVRLEIRLEDELIML
jgi:hypothetical protein